MSGQADDDHDPKKSPNGSQSRLGHEHGDDHEGHDHAHDHEHGDHDHGDEGADPELLTAIIENAQSGLKTDVQTLLNALLDGNVFIPLAEDIADAPEGEKIDFDGALSFRPHMLVHEDGSVFAVAYSEPELVEPLMNSLKWDTSGEDLKFLHLSARVALDLGQARVENVEVTGLVLNPGSEGELVLLRDEVGSLLQGTALPLVGYVSQLPEGMEDQTEVIEGAEEPPAALLAELDQIVTDEDDLQSFLLQTTFNPERDREPHLTLTLTLSHPGVDRHLLADSIMQRIGPHLPAPGYADLVFRELPN